MMDGQRLMFKLCADNSDIIHKVSMFCTHLEASITSLLAGARAYYSAYFGQGTGPILLDYVACSGSEATLLQCSYSNTTSDDTHSEDAGAQCQPC